VTEKTDQTQVFLLNVIYLSSAILSQAARQRGTVIMAKSVSLSLSLSLSLSVLTATFQVFIEAKDDVGGGDNWSYKLCKLQSNHHHQQTNIQFFYRPDALPVTQPTVSKH